jgi:hypothetical protein
LGKVHSCGVVGVGVLAYWRGFALLCARSETVGN